MCCVPHGFGVMTTKNYRLAGLFQYGRIVCGKRKDKSGTKAFENFVLSRKGAGYGFSQNVNGDVYSGVMIDGEATGSGVK